MALPSSGVLSIGDIRYEQANWGGLTPTGSLRQLSANAAFSSPDSISEFYGYGLTTTNLQLYLTTISTTSYPGSGTIWYDVSGNGYNATMSGTVPYVAGTPGVINAAGYFNYSGGAYYFNGNNSLASKVTTQVTISVVASITNMSLRSFVFNKFWVTSSPYGYVLEIGSDGGGAWTNSMRFYGSGYNNNSTDLRGTTSLTQNQMYLFTVTYNQATASNIMYANASAISATQAGVGSDAGFSQGTNNYQLGTLTGPERSYMKQYAVLVWNRALTSTEITTNYNFLKPIYGIS